MIQSRLNSCLCHAVESGNIEEVGTYLKLGADVHTVAGYPLRWGSFLCNKQICILLLEYGADFDESISGAIKNCWNMTHIDRIYKMRNEIETELAMENL